MPDLGPYALEVTSAYAITLALLAALIGFVVLRGRAVKRQLAETEARQGGGNAR